MRPTSPSSAGGRSSPSAFLEDTWRITPRLQVRAGFRSESSTGWSESQEPRQRLQLWSRQQRCAARRDLHESHCWPVQRAHRQPRPLSAGAARRTRMGRIRQWPHQRYRQRRSAPFPAGCARLSARPGCTLQHRQLLLQHHRGQPDQRHAEDQPFHRRHATSPRLRCSPTPSGSSSSLRRPRLSRSAITGRTAITRSLTAISTSRTSRFFRTESSTIPRRPRPTTPWRIPPRGGRAARATTTPSSWICGTILSNGLQFRINYTWSKNLDDGSAWNTSVSSNTPAFVSVPALPQLDYGPAATDVRHLFAANATYDLPIGRGQAFFADPTSSPSTLSRAGGSLPS